MIELTSKAAEKVREIMKVSQEPVSLENLIGKPERMAEDDVDGASAEDHFGLEDILSDSAAADPERQNN